jgi:S1-C subfamily serine protease
VRIGRVASGSPAAEAGLKAGTRLLAAGGRPLSAPLDFQNVLLDLRAGDQVTVMPEGGRPVTLATEALPSVRAERIRILEDLELITVTPEVQAERGVRSESGALVVGISPELQGQLGFAVGDVIIQVNNVRVATAEDAAAVLARLRGRGAIQIYFERGGALQSVSFYWRG